MYKDFIMSNPVFIVWDITMGMIFDIYMDAILKSYYWPIYLAGHEDEWRQTISKMIVCKV